MFIAALFTTAKKWKQPKCATSEWINKKVYYLAIRRNQVLIHATTWMNPKNIMLSERSQT